MGRVTIGIQRLTKVPEGRPEGGIVLAVLWVVAVGVEAHHVVAGTEGIATTVGLVGMAVAHGTGRHKSSRSCGKR